MLEVMSRFIGWELTPLEHYLVRSNGATTTSRQLKRQRSGSKWEERHKVLFASKGLGEAHSITDDTIYLYPALGSLQEREKQILTLNGITDFPEATMRTMELRHNSLWLRNPNVGYVPSVTPSSRIYLSKVCRVLEGREFLQLQSIYYPDSVIASVPTATITSLGGNAFEACCCLSAIVSLCTCLSHGAVQRASGSPSRFPAPSNDTQSDCDDDDLDLSLVRKIAIPAGPLEHIEEGG